MLYFGSRYNITETFLYETVNKPGVISQTNKRSIMYHVAIIIIPAEITSRLITHIYLFNDRLSHLKIYARFSVLTVDLLLINSIQMHLIVMLYQLNPSTINMVFNFHYSYFSTALRHQTMSFNCIILSTKYFFCFHRETF